MAEPETQPDAEHRTLRAMGITILGVILSIATTVALGLSALPWWGRIGAGALVAVALVLLIKVGTRQGRRGPLSRAADWIASGRG